MDSSVSPKDKIWFLHVCHHTSNAVYCNNTYLLTCSMEQSPSWEAKRLSTSQEIPTFYRTQSFITMLTSAQHLSLSWASSIQPMPLHPTSWRSILILSYHLCLGFTSCLFPLGFPTKTLYAPPFSHLHATCPTNPNLLDLITWIIFGEEYRSSSSSLFSFLHSPVTSSLLGLNILLSTLCSPQATFVPQCEQPSFTPVQNNGQIISLSLYFWITNWQTKDSALNDSNHSLTLH